MRSLVHALNRTRTSGQPLPDRWRTFSANGIKFRKGQVHMVAGQPGSGKSLLALDYVVNADVSALYFSADSDDATVVARVAAMRLGKKLDEVEEMMESSASVLIEDELAELDRIRFCFNPTPTLDDIDEELMAWNELYIDPPDVIIVDNLINVVCETTDNEWQGLRHLMGSMHELARQTMSALLVLHHTSEGEGKSNEPQARKSLMGKVAQLPELILTVALDPATSEYRVAAVKNRSGKADAAAQSWLTLYADLPKMTLTETAPITGVSSYWDEVG